MFNMAPTLRALTAGSPITTAMHQARRMAQRYLERGGAVVSAKAQPKSAGFLVPGDVDAAALATAIEAKLRAGRNKKNDLPNVLERRQDREIVVPRVVLERLGAGNATRGEQLLARLMSEMRGRRILVASQTRQR
jgi:hypothetical protein